MALGLGERAVLPAQLPPVWQNPTLPLPLMPCPLRLPLPVPAC